MALCGLAYVKDTPTPKDLTLYGVHIHFPVVVVSGSSGKTFARLSLAGVEPCLHTVLPAKMHLVWKLDRYCRTDIIFDCSRTTIEP